MPLVASAQADLIEGGDNCHGVIVSFHATMFDGIVTRFGGQNVGEIQHFWGSLCGR